MRSLSRVIVGLVATVTALTVAVAPASAGTPFKVTISVAQSKIELGQNVKLTGKVTGSSGLKDKTVTLYWASAVKDDPWHKIGAVKLSSTGTYSKYFKPVDGGPTLFRAYKGSVSGHAAANGYSGAVDVYRWQSLHNFWDDTTADFGTHSTASTGYRGAFLIKESAPAFFDTSEAGCTRLRGETGVLSRSGSAVTSGTLNVAYDGFIPTFFALFGAATAHGSVGFSSKVATGNDLLFYADMTPDSADDGMVVGDAEALCNAPL